MKHMRSASIRDLHIRTSELVREASAGAFIVIARRGQPVAELRPIIRKPKPVIPDMSHFWNDFPQLQSDSGAFVEEDRDR